MLIEDMLLVQKKYAKHTFHLVVSTCNIFNHNSYHSFIRHAILGLMARYLQPPLENSADRPILRVTSAVLKLLHSIQ